MSLHVEHLELLRERDEARAEALRLRNIIGELYMARGGSRQELSAGIRRAFFASHEDQA